MGILDERICVEVSLNIASALLQFDWKSALTVLLKYEDE